eukprot:1217666-Rhodomonas_salina.1
MFVGGGCSGETDGCLHAEEIDWCGNRSETPNPHTKKTKTFQYKLYRESFSFLFSAWKEAALPGLSAGCGFVFGFLVLWLFTVVIAYYVQCSNVLFARVFALPPTARASSMEKTGRQPTTTKMVSHVPSRDTAASTVTCPVMIPRPVLSRALS